MRGCCFRLSARTAFFCPTQISRSRDGVIAVAANKISAGVSTGVGTHSDKAKKGDEQFEISDARSVEEILGAVRGLNLQPVMSEHIYV